MFTVLYSICKQEQACCITSKLYVLQEEDLIYGKG